METKEYSKDGLLILENSLRNHVIEDDEIQDEEARRKEIEEIKRRCASLTYQKRHFMDDRLITLIRELNKKYDFSKVFDYNIWICGYADEDETEIDTDHPFFCCHYYERKDREFYLDPTSVFPWWYFDVEDYLLEVGMDESGIILTVWLHVKLVEISKDPSRRGKQSESPSEQG